MIESQTRIYAPLARKPTFLASFHQQSTNNPQATVQKIVSEILPPSAGMGFTKDARDLLIECCVEFITLISSEANEISEKESKKTIAVEHITKALEQLGFGDYVADIVEIASEHKEQLKVCFLSLFFDYENEFLVDAGGRGRGDGGGEGIREKEGLWANEVNRDVKRKPIS